MAAGEIPYQDYSWSEEGSGSNKLMALVTEHPVCCLLVPYIGLLL